MITKKTHGSPSTLSQDDVNDIVHFIISSPIKRSMIHLKLAAILLRDLGSGERLIQREFRVRGYKQYHGIRSLHHPKEL